MMNNLPTYPRPSYCDHCEDTATVWVPNGTTESGWDSYCKECDPYCDSCIRFIWDCTCWNA